MANGSNSTSDFGFTSGVQNYLEELQKWEQETFQQMRLRKEAQRAKINASLNQVQELFEQQNLQDILEPCTSAQSNKMITAPAKNDQIGMKTSTNMEGFPKNSVKKVTIMENVLITDIPAQTHGQRSLEEIVEQQLKKLMVDDAKGENELSIEKPKYPQKRPFLKKGAGRRRFIPNPISYPKKTVRRGQEKDEASIPSSRTVKSQSKVCKKINDGVLPNQPSPSVQFCLPTGEVPVIIASGLKPPAPHAEDDIEGKELHKEKGAQTLVREVEELAQYEVLEDFAQHTSFNSDSSLIVDFLNPKDKKENPRPNEMVQNAGPTQSGPPLLEHAHTKSNFIDPLSADLQTLRQRKMDFETLRQRKMDLENQLRNYNNALEPFKDDAISTVPKEIFDVSSSSEEETVVPKNVEIESRVAVKETESYSMSATQALLREKLEELEKEIAIYKTESSVLGKLKKQRDDELRSLQKDKEDFAKFKQEELSKLNKEVAEKRSQIQREKQTFERYQKLRRDFPGRKEKDELNTLKQKSDSLQEELKKKTVKFNAETKRLRKLLEAIEKERDILKLGNQKLSERIDEMSILNKERTSLMELKPKRVNTYRKEQKEKVEAEHDDENFDDELVSEFSPLKDDVFEKVANISDDMDEMDPKPHVRFNLDPEIQRFSPESHSSNYKEIQHGNKVERIYNNGDRLILFQSGSRKFISADGLHIKFEFFNGDKQETFPDKLKVYTYSNGVVERSYPDGLRVTEFPNQQVEKYFPDGTKQATYPSGVVITQRTDGVEETKTQDGSVTTVFPNGTVIIEFASGDKEIRTADFLRREFADGSIKTVYKSGRSETRRPNGRIRVKDKDGNVLFDNIVT